MCSLLTLTPPTMKVSQRRRARRRHESDDVNVDDADDDVDDADGDVDDADDDVDDDRRRISRRGITPMTIYMN